MARHVTMTLAASIRLTVAALASLLIPSAASAASPKLPDANVLLITIDTLRYDRVSILSDKYVKTPHIDALARRGLNFIRAYAHNPLTRPSHTNILTGTTPLYHGVTDNPGFKLEPRFLTMADYLKARGYGTGAFIGAFILDRRFGLNKGFDLYDDLMGEQDIGRFGFVERTADQVVGPAMKWIAAQKGKWFCWVHLFDPHDPYTPPPPFSEQYKNDPYSGEVAFVDQELGRLFDALDASGTAGKTIIVLTADHGEAFGEKGEIHHGLFAYDNTIHIPLVIAYPGATPATVRENACHIDIFPTVCDLLGAALPPGLQGESLLPMAAGKSRRRPLIYFESMNPHLTLGAAPLSGFIRGKLKFIDLPVKEVYDLEADPLEERNLASTADIPALLRSLDTLKTSLKGPGTTQDLAGRNPEILPLLRSLGYVSGGAVKKDHYGVEDDPKTLVALIVELRQAVEEFQAGRTDAALAKFDGVIRARPTFVSAYSDLANAYYNLGRADQAVAVLKDGLVKNSDSLHLTARLGIMMVLAKRYGEAVEPLEYVIKKDAYDPDNFNYLGMAYLATGNLVLAKETLDRALALDPNHVAVYNNLGYLGLAFYKKTGDRAYLDSAVANFDKALARKPDLESAKKGRAAAVAALR